MRGLIAGILLLWIAASPALAGGEGPCRSDAEVQRTVQRISSGSGGSFWAKFRDPKDGQLDMSGWLESNTGFLPVPIVITEPAVGLGFGVVPAFFHKQKDPTRKGPTGRPVPPSVSALGGFYTANDSWGAFGGHMGIWKDDRIRYTGGAGYVSVNLDLYGIASELGSGGRRFNIEGFAFLQELDVRIGSTDLFVGAKYIYFKSNITFERILDIPWLPPAELDSSNAGASLLLTWDSRDNIFTPNNGIRAQASYTRYDEWLGGDFAYQEVDAYALWWKQIAPKWNLGLRLDGKFTDGDAPFYALPFIQLRGVPAMRYQGDDILVAEAEARWDFAERWSAVGFTGAGRAVRNLGDLLGLDEQRGQEENAWNVGGGFRYLLARKLGLRAGIDIARGPEEWAFYLTVGSGWLRL